MQYLDIDKWERKEQYRLFHNMDYPHISICANVDITTLLPKVKENKLSFYNSMIYITCKTANAIKEFRYRIRGENVVIHDSVHPSFTYLKNKTDEVFNFCIIEYNTNFLEFDKAIKNKINETNKVDLSDEEGKDDMLFISSIPWISFTSISHPISLNKDNSIPRLAWGKYFNEGEKIKMPFSVQVNHALIDGFQLGKFFELLQENIEKFKLS